MIQQDMYIETIKAIQADYIPMVIDHRQQDIQGIAIVIQEINIIATVERDPDHLIENPLIVINQYQIMFLKQINE